MLDIKRLVEMFSFSKSVVEQLTTTGDKRQSSILEEIRDETQEIKSSIQEMLDEGHDVADALTSIYVLLVSAIEEASSDSTRGIAPVHLQDARTLKHVVSYIADNSLDIK